MLYGRVHKSKFVLHYNKSHFDAVCTASNSLCNSQYVSVSGKDQLFEPFVFLACIGSYHCISKDKATS
jgi:hypothetical protein